MTSIDDASQELIRQSIANTERLISRASNADITISNEAFDTLQRIRVELSEIQKEIVGQ